VKHPETEKPLTRRELARLFRVFAHLLETAEEPEEGGDGHPRIDRPAPEASVESPKIDDLTRAKAKRALERSGFVRVTK
jgi:hypothetical protein